MIYQMMADDDFWGPLGAPVARGPRIIDTADTAVATPLDMVSSSTSATSRHVRYERVLLALTKPLLTFHAALDPAPALASLMFPDVYPYFEEVDVYESPPDFPPYNTHPRLTAAILTVPLPYLLSLLYSHVLLAMYHYY
ncbi:unnamed protein product [Chrysodeixis includens]|uniref:Uncharacterized protein n=1 Tax=Chrysodeixis includens TaxID=689277 RepID=A0A9N8PYI7_CHRIL|nr:unnamed protein product [Chrysodeixis includens]